MKKANLFFIVLLLFIQCPSSAKAEVRLPAIIGSHMVLQQKSDVTLWGWADPGEKVNIKVDWDTVTYIATTAATAKWSIQVKTPAAGGPYKIVITGNNSNIVLEDILIGEVWLCSGQSNMEMNVNWGLPYNDEAANANNQNIRFFHIAKSATDYPQEDVKAKWVVCSPSEMKAFSAAGYFFGKELQQQLNSPVGLINATWGGTPAETWTPAPLVNNDSVLKAAASRLSPSKFWPVTPGSTYNGMIHAITPFAIAGTIWYQGEANVGTADTYQSVFTTMIGAWRKAWKKDFPFYYAQIAPFAGYGDKNTSARLREAQTQSLSYPNVGMIVTSDLVDNIKDIHPKMKKEVGLRLANYALAETYGKKNVAYKSPLYKSMKIEKGKIRIFFEHADNGLMTKGSKPTEFYIAGADSNFVAADARIEKNTVVVWSKKVKFPVAVRFGFSNHAMPDLYSREGLPVNLFRTDSWPVFIEKANRK